MTKSCELCKSAARMYCESDQASLCWDCDVEVHSANFLVARHSRCLLCHVCQSATAWSASGSRLGQTVSVCERCVDGCDNVRNDDSVGGDEVSDKGENDTEDDYDGDDDDDDDDDEEDEEDEDVLDEDEDGDNQVVPWSSTPPPPAASSSSSEELFNRFSNGDGDVSLKRVRETISDLRSDDDHGCTSSARIGRTAPRPTAAVARGNGGGEAVLVDTLASRPLKSRRLEANLSQNGPAAGSRSTAAIVESLRRFDEQDMESGNNASETIAGICRLSRNPGAVDSDSAESS